MSTQPSLSSRGHVWFEALTAGAGAVASALRSVSVADAALGGEPARFIAVVPDAHNRFPRARSGEVGIDEGWALALHVRHAIAADHDGARRPIIAVVDVSSQAYGRREELLGIHLACAAAAQGGRGPSHMSASRSVTRSSACTAGAGPLSIPLLRQTPAYVD